MFRRGFERLSLLLSAKVVGAAGAGFYAGRAYQDRQNRGKLNSDATILKTLKINPQEAREILAKEEALYDKTQQELKAMKQLLSPNEINLAIEKMGQEIANKFHDEKHLLVLTMLQGACYLASDLKKQLYNKYGLLFKEDAIRVSRYGDSHDPGKAKIERFPSSENIVGRKILIIEDLIEEGVTLQLAVNELIKRGAKREDIYIAVLTDKANARKEGYEDLQPDFWGYQMQDNQWVVGYGCDQAGFARPKEELLYFPAAEQQKFGYGK